MSDEDEVLDLVDAFDEVIRPIPRSDYDQIVKENLGFIRAAELFIVNDKGELWTPVRNADKKIAPNGYDYASAGHVETGESYLETLLRETEEELNLTITKGDVEFVAKLKSNETKYIREVYVHKSNIAPNYNRDDYQSAEWLTPETLLKNITNGHLAKVSLPVTIPVLQAYLQT